MKKAYIYGGVAIVILLLVVVGFVLFSDNSVSNKISPISIIKYTDENSTFIITKYNLDKTAKVNMELYLGRAEIKNDFMDLTELMTSMGCGLMQMAFFNQTALDEFNQEIQKLSSMNGTIEDDSGNNLGVAKGNPLDGYEVIQANYYLKDKQTRFTMSDCVITGPSKDEIKITYY